MKAAVVTEQGVQYKDAPKPSPKPHELLIKVKAASLNRADLAVASGHRHGTVGGTGTIVGLECAGEVEAVGSDVKDFKPGDRVMSSAAGSFAEMLSAALLKSAGLILLPKNGAPRLSCRPALHAGEAKAVKSPLSIAAVGTRAKSPVFRASSRMRSSSSA